MNSPDSARFPLAAPLVLALCTATMAFMLSVLRGDRAPAVVFTIIAGNHVRLESLRGRPLLVNFWATTCSICRREIPKLAALYRELQPRGLELIGVAMPYDPPNLVAEYARRSSIPYPVSLDVDAGIVSAFGGITVTPTTFLIGPDGRVLRRQEGMLDFGALRLQILELVPRARPQGHEHRETAPANATAQIAMRERW